MNVGEKAGWSLWVTAAAWGGLVVGRMALLSTPRGSVHDWRSSSLEPTPHGRASSRSSAATVAEKTLSSPQSLSGLFVFFGLPYTVAI